MQAPILAYPRFNSEAPPFLLQTDTSAVGIGAVLEQDGHVVGYTSHTLTKSEQQYSVIQRECLLTVYGMKQFRHYLLGHAFKLITDHAPLQWLSAQTMKGLFCLWSLAIQEYDFAIVYRKGSLNTVADAMSRRVQPEVPSAATQLRTDQDKEEMKRAQHSDPVIKALCQSSVKPKGRKWHRPPLICYRRMWHRRECQTCQRSKLPTPTRAPLVSVLIGKPWEMVAVDLPILCKGNR